MEFESMANVLEEVSSEAVSEAVTESRESVYAMWFSCTCRLRRKVGKRKENISIVIGEGK